MPGPQKSKPQVPVVVDSNGKATSKENIPFQRIVVSSDDLRGKDGKVDPDALARHLTQVQDNVDAATKSQRTSPLNRFVIIKMVSLNSGANTTIRHRLGAPWAFYQVMRVYPGAGFPIFAEVPNNGGLDPSLFLVLTASTTSAIDLAIYAS